MSTSNLVLSPRFDVGTAALEHLELLNRSNLNPLEIAAQFRTLLRSKKPRQKTSTIEYTYTDYIANDATYRRRARSRSQIDYQSKFLNQIQYDRTLRESYSSSKCPTEDDSSIEDNFTDSALGSDSSDRTTHKNLSSSLNPTVNWKQIREKQNEGKRQFSTNRSQADSAMSESHTYSNISELRKHFEQTISSCSSPSPPPISRSRCSSNSIRTPSISPINYPEPRYTISRLNLTSMNNNNGDIFFPIADCNLVIKHKTNKLSQCPTIIHFKNLDNENKLSCHSAENTAYL